MPVNRLVGLWLESVLAKYPKPDTTSHFSPFFPGFSKGVGNAAGVRAVDGGQENSRGKSALIYILVQEVKVLYTF
jgi:hypothetical protein